MLSTVASVRANGGRQKNWCELNQNTMKTIVQSNSPGALLQRRSLTLSRHQQRNRWPSQHSFLAPVVNDADLQNPWEHAAWIVLGLVALMLVLLTFWLS